MSRNSPQPKIQTRAKRARIQSQRALSPECTLITPSPLNKPLEASSVPTTSGFNGVFGSNKNNHLSDNRNNEPNIHPSGSCHTSQITPCFSPNSDFATTTQNDILLTAGDSNNNIQTMVGENKLNLTNKGNLVKSSMESMGPLFTQTIHSNYENTTTSFINNTHNDFIPYSTNNDKISHTGNYVKQAIRVQGDINSSIHNIKSYNNETNSPNLGNKGCLPVSQTVVPEHLASSNTEQELHMVELEILSQTKRLRELKLQQKKKTLLLLRKEANAIELDMQANCKGTSQQNYSGRPKMIHGEYCHIVNDPIKTGFKYNPNSHDIVDCNLPGVGYRGVTLSNRISELKSIIKIDIAANPRDEISYFEDMCRSLEIFDSQVRYQVLTSVWPHKDIRNFYTTVEYERRCYNSLIDYLANRDGQLGRVFLPRPDCTTLNGQSLELEVTKWEAEMRDPNTLRKFLYIHLAPDHLKSKMREVLSLDIENYKRRCRDICDVDQQRSREASKNINYSSSRSNQRRGKFNNHINSYRHIGQNSGYQNNTNRYLGHQGCNFINDTRVANNQVDNFQGQIQHNNTPVFNGYQARQNSNHNNMGNPGTLGTLCHRHRRFGENAYECAAPRTCEMAGIRAQRPTKNDFPSSSQ